MVVPLGALIVPETPPLENGALVEVTSPLNKPLPGEVAPNCPATYDSACAVDVRRILCAKRGRKADTNNTAPIRAIFIHTLRIPRLILPQASYRPTYRGRRKM